MKPSASFIRRAEAARAGLTDSDLRRLTAAGELERLRRGGYLSAVEFRALDQITRHAADVFTAVAAQRETTIVSHQSAAILLGLPLWATPLQRVHLAKHRVNAGRVTPLLHVHATPLTDDEIVLVDGLLVTSPSRTVLDLALSIPFEQAVVVTDAALHAGLVAPDQLADMLERSGRRKGRSRAHLVFGFADGRSESVGESRSRVGMHRAGLRQPGLQKHIYTADGDLAGISDFDWDLVLGEFDGLIKYGRLLRPGETPGDAVTREKIREDVLRDLGHRMVRWIWTELDAPTVLWPRVGRSIARWAT